VIKRVLVRIFGLGLIGNLAVLMIPGLTGWVMAQEEPKITETVA
jgi:hypothetical protein